MSAVDPNGGGVIVIPSSTTNATSIQGRAVASTAPTTGQVYQWSGSEWVPATVSGSPSVTYDPMTGEDWSTMSPSGGGDASWSGGALLLDCDTAGASSCGVEQSDYLPSGDYFDAAIRVQITGGDGSAQGRILLSDGASADDCAVMMLFPDGSIEVGAFVASSYVYWYVASTIAAIDNAARTGGELWLRIHRAPGLIEWSWGLGVSGALPTVWNPVYSSIQKEVAGYYAPTVQNGLRSSNGRYMTVSAFTLSTLALQVSVLDIATGLPGAFGSE